jgi:genome maintenance exonuclease 1
MAHRKIFKHNFVAEVDDIGMDYENGKRYYFLPNGQRFRSVTTVISEKADKSFLIEWRKRVGEEEAQKTTTRASKRGTAMHTLAENYILNKDYKDGVIPSNLDMFNTIKPYLDEHVDNVLGIELALYSNFLRAAGRTDLVAEYKGIPSIIVY